MIFLSCCCRIKLCEKEVKPYIMSVFVCFRLFGTEKSICEETHERFSGDYVITHTDSWTSNFVRHLRSLIITWSLRPNLNPQKLKSRQMSSVFLKISSLWRSRIQIGPHKDTKPQSEHSHTKRTHYQRAFMRASVCMCTPSPAPWTLDCVSPRHGIQIGSQRRHDSAREPAWRNATARPRCNIGAPFSSSSQQTRGGNQSCVCEYKLKMNP